MDREARDRREFFLRKACRFTQCLELRTERSRSGRFHGLFILLPRSYGAVYEPCSGAVGGGGRLQVSQVYRVTFPKDSIDPPSGNVPSRVNLPGDVEVDTATRDGSLGTITFSTGVLSQSFSVLNTSQAINDFRTAARARVRQAILNSRNP
jgi:hypothetical protein